MVAAVRLSPLVLARSPPLATTGGPWHATDVVWPSLDLYVPSLPGGEQYTLAADAPSARVVAMRTSAPL